MGLTFDVLREANIQRAPEFKNKKGELNPSKDWTSADWMNALVGEVGELANILKKVKRGDYTMEEKFGEVARELADIQTYLDLLANNLNVNLGSATIMKWNEVSAKVGSSLRLYNDGVCRVKVEAQRE